MTKQILLAMLTLLLLFTGCGDDNPADPGDNNTIEIPQVYRDLPGTLIDSDTTWSGTVTLRGQHYVLPGVTLTIEPGTTVEWDYHNDNVDDVGVLITLPADDDNFEDGARASGKLIAEGTADSPIVFTSGRTDKQPGDWGGIILVGEAPNNISGGQGEVEGLPQSIRYGGTNTDDDSGSLRYVRIEYVGFGFTSDSEVNGLSLYSVGNQTTMEYIQVYKCTDDGFEWFGGSVNARYLVSMYNDDDSFDMDEGWEGKGQFWVAVQADGADSGFESDGVKTLGSGDETDPTLYNITLIGHGATEGGDSNDGMHLREEFTGSLNNFIVTGFGGYNWFIAEDTGAKYSSGELALNSILVWDNGGWDGEGATTYAGDYTESNPMFADAAAFDLRPTAPEAAAGQGETPPNDGYFDSGATYLGALNPEGANWLLEGSWVRTDDN